MTPFCALCGFRPYEEIHSLCIENPELIDLLGAEQVAKILTDPLNGLKESFQKLMKSSEAEVSDCIKKISIRFGPAKVPDDVLRTVFWTLNEEFPGDVGILCIFFLNILELKSGQAIYLPANEPHAYLEGDCIECMACSDNVIRAGLTPKFKDVDTLIRMLNYNGEPATNKIFKPIEHPKYKYTKLYIPKVKDFAVAEIHIPQESETEYTIENREFGSIILVLFGEGTLSMNNYPDIKIGHGSIVFLPANTGKEVRLEIENSGTSFFAYQAMYNDF